MSIQAQRWDLIQEIFLAAMELPEADVADFLNGVCVGDSDLRLEVERLLQGDRHQTRDFGRLAKRDSFLGRRIGAYKIARELGRGGMGSVYEAVRVDDQYQRSVAIKLIGASSLERADSLERFRTERQILAKLQHPNIAAMLDGGTTDEGQPYYVMEYIDGKPIIDYCRSKSLSVPQRLELFCAICAAVHHAHQMLVLHRDIKPANVLVTAGGVPKLLDFGIAKLLTSDEFADTQAVTRTELRRLTPQYASPEQIRGEPLTTASDVYSLGVLLYEMVTFAIPYRVTGRSMREIEQAICEGQPLRRKQLSGDLETIAAMALRKEPQRRYPSAQKLAEDVQRYLQGRPVSARQDTLLYVAGKLIRRNKVATAALALTVVSIIVGWSATIREMRRSDARFQEVRKLAVTLFSEFNSQIQKLPSSTPVRERLVHTALDYLNALSADSGNDLALKWDISQAYEHVGDVQGDPSGANLGQFTEALSNYRKALALVEQISLERRDWKVLSCMTWLYYKVGDLELRSPVNVHKVTQEYEKGIATAATVQRELRDGRADDLLYQGYERLAKLRLRVADTAAALENAKLAAAAAERHAQWRRSARSLANLARTDLLTGRILSLRGDMHGARRHYQDAIARLEPAIADKDEREAAQELQDAYRNLGDLQGNAAFFNFGNAKLAELYHRKSVAMAETLAAHDLRDAPSQGRLSMALRRLGGVRRSTNPQESMEAYRRALAIVENLAQRTSDDVTYRREIALTKMGLAQSLHAVGRRQAALTELEAALQAQRQLIAGSPERVNLREDLFDTLLALADVRVDMGEYKTAKQLLDEATETAQLLTRSHRESLYSQRCIALAERKFGDYYVKIGNPRKADQSYKRALAIWSRWRTEGLAVPYSTHREQEIVNLRLQVGDFGKAASKGAVEDLLSEE